MTNPRGSKANSLAGIRAERKRAEQREKAKEKRDGAKVRQKYKNKKKPKFSPSSDINLGFCTSYSVVCDIISQNSLFSK